MAQQNVGLEWHIGEDAFHTQAPNGPQPQNAHRFGTIFSTQATSRSELRMLLDMGRWLLCFVAACILVGGTAVSPRDEALRDAYSGVYAWLDAAEESWQLDDRDGHSALIDPTIPGDWQREWRFLWGGNGIERNEFGLKLQDLSLSTESGIIRADYVNSRASAEWWRSSPYRETHFYRATDQGLLRTVPRDSFWGEQMNLESDYVRLEFHAADAQLANTILDDLDEAYLTLHEIMGLDIATESAKMTIVLDTALPRRWQSSQRQHRLTTPILDRVPLGLSDSDYLKQRIVGRFSSMVLRDAIPDTQRSYLSQWETIVWALDGWMRTHVLEQRTPWHEQAEAWIHSEPPDERPLSILDIGPWQNQGVPRQKEMMKQYILAESVIDYMVATYGRDQLPRLLNAITRYSNWSDLVVALYGVPIETVNAGWNQYLEERFDWDALDEE